MLDKITDALGADICRKYSGKLAELNADNIEAQELTKRQEADMASDSWLSKNIRPMTLVFILLVYSAFATMSAPRWLTHYTSTMRASCLYTLRTLVQEASESLVDLRVQSVGSEQPRL